MFLPKDFFKSLLELIKKVEYTLLVLVMSVECILVAGFSNFMVKFNEQIYQVSPSKSSVLTGGVVVPSAIVGAILGGFLVKKFDWHIKGCIRLILVGSTVVIVGIVIALFIQCNGTPSIGINTNTQT